jgi:nicotinate-nucleotide--dimethylbenzimidazole phosphoribosyltransferase
MAALADCRVIPVDMGMRDFLGHPGVLDRRVRNGTEDLSLGPAMDRGDCLIAMAAGAELAAAQAEDGADILLIGEMGIGNTTAASAITSVLLSLAPEIVTGRGAGLSDAGLIRKVAAIRRAIAVNHPDREDPIDVLSKVGGYEIAGMVGAYLGGYQHHIPTVTDGMIPNAAALLAARLCPETVSAILPGHVSREPADCRIMKELGMEPMIHADMALGEGTGGVLLLPLLDMALRVYHGPHTFAGLGMEPYTPQGGLQ